MALGYFADPNCEIPYDTINLECRKVVQYITFVDSGDAIDPDSGTGGHGSHVAGIAAGRVVLHIYNHGSCYII
jgi:hypothetical protein